jgi:glucose-1-phosphatase
VPPATMTKSIIFDLGNVIVPFDFSRAYAAMESHCPFPAAEIRSRIWSTDLVHRFEAGAIEGGDFVKELSALLEMKVDEAVFRRLWSSIFFSETLIPEGLIAVLRRNYRVMLLSNTNALHFEMLRETYPHFRHFDDFVLSFEVKAMKPSPLIYQEAVRRARCLAAECFFVDDIESNVTAAKEAGLDAVQFKSLEQLTAALRSRGVCWKSEGFPVASSILGQE